MTTKTVDTMSLLGGHPVLDFVNTIDSRIGQPGPDYLTSYDDLLIWAGRTHLIDAETQQRLSLQAAKMPVKSVEALSHAKALREALFGICCTEISDQPAEQSDLDLFNAALQKAQAERQISIGPRGPDLDLAISRHTGARCGLCEYRGLRSPDRSEEPPAPDPPVPRP